LLNIEYIKNIIRMNGLNEQSEQSTKQCGTCDEVKPLAKFHFKNRCDKIVYNYQCKICSKAQAKKDGKRSFHLECPREVPDGMKHCTKCDTDKPITDFHTRIHNGKMGIMYRCKPCDNSVSRQERKTLYADPEKKANLLALNRKNHEKNASKYYAQKKERKKQFPVLVVLDRCRARLKYCLTSGMNWEKYLGCSTEFLRGWFEYQFRLVKTFNDVDLNWENIKTWHIDHVIPCKVFDFSDEIQIKTCFHWSNLSPMLIDDNISKSSKIIPQLIRRQVCLAYTYKTITSNFNKTVAIAEICDETGALDTAALEKLSVQQVE
jgi:hypothetical protein